MKKTLFSEQSIEGQLQGVISSQTSIQGDITNIKYHMDIMNSETGELRDIIKEIKNDLTAKAIRNAENIEKLTLGQAQIGNDVDWIKRTYWVVATSAIGALIVGIITLLTKK